jgi:hypothetical protein
MSAFGAKVTFGRHPKSWIFKQPQIDMGTEMIKRRAFLAANFWPQH